MRLVRLALVALILVVAATSVIADGKEWLKEVEHARIEAETYCVTQWPSTPEIGAGKWQKPRRPIVLISGMMLEMRSRALNVKILARPHFGKFLVVIFRLG